MTKQPQSVIGILAILLLAFIESSAQDGPGRRALLVGVSGYERQAPDSWSKLSTRDEVLQLKETLQRKFRFRDQDILVLTSPQETTREAILTAFRNHLIKPTMPGDIAFFHFSGHGQPIPDDGMDELDGYDESLVPSDYVSKQNGDGNIRDDRLGQLIAELKKRRPSSILISLDACYSGTATRGESEERGDMWRGVPVPASRVRAEESSPSGLDGVKGYVVIAAAAPRQSAKTVRLADSRQMGLFTWSLIQELELAGPQTSYRDLHDAVTNRVTSRNQLQNPQVEGEIDTLLLNGTAQKQAPFFGVRVDRNQQIWLDGGRLQGVTRGSRFVIQPAGARSADEPGQLATAEVVEVEAARASLKLTAAVDPARLRLSRAFESRHSYEGELIRVATRNFDRVERGEEVRREIASFEGASLDNVTFDLMIRGAESTDDDNPAVGRNFRGVIIEQQNGILLEKIDATPEIAARIRQILDREWRQLAVRSIERIDPKLDVEVRVVPVATEKDPQTGEFRPLPPRYDQSGQLTIRAGEFFRVEVRNRAPHPAYVTVLNLATDRTISQVWPESNSGKAESSNYFKAAQGLDPGQWRKISTFEAGKPAGRESFMVIATTTPVDFKPLFEGPARSGDDRSRRGSGLLRQLSLPIRSRSGDADESLSSPPDWATRVVSFKITER